MNTDIGPYEPLFTRIYKMSEMERTFIVSCGDFHRAMKRDYAIRGPRRGFYFRSFFDDLSFRGQQLIMRHARDSNGRATPRT